MIKLTELMNEATKRVVKSPGVGGDTFDVGKALKDIEQEWKNEKARAVYNMSKANSLTFAGHRVSGTDDRGKKFSGMCTGAEFFFSSSDNEWKLAIDLRGENQPHFVSKGKITVGGYESLLEAPKYGRDPNKKDLPVKKPHLTKHAMYEVSSGLISMREDAEEMKDKQLQKLIQNTDKEWKKVWDYMGSNYNWD